MLLLSARSRLLTWSVLTVTLGWLAGGAHAATLCPGIQDGAATTNGHAAAYSDCTFSLAGDDYYFAIENNGGTVNVLGKLNSTDFSPSAGTKVITGGSAASAVYGVVNEGAGYTGECDDVSGSDPGGGVALVAGDYYCAIFDSTTGPRIWIRSQWTGSQFGDTTVAYGSTLPVELQTFSIE
jgi:hypothetical protein